MSANFPFQENIDVFVGEKTDKEYWLKISSQDSNSTTPFDFDVKFTMNVSTGPNKYIKEAIIEDKYQQIKRLEVTDVIIPRYIPNNTLGLNFDGVNLVNNATDISGHLSRFLIACYPGINMKCGTNYVRLTNYKDSVVLTDISNSILFNSDISNNFKYKDFRIIDHLTIENIV